MLFRLEVDLPSWLSCEAIITEDGIVSVVIRDSTSAILRIKLQSFEPFLRNQRVIHYQYADFSSWSAFEQKVMDIYRSWARNSLW